MAWTKTSNFAGPQGPSGPMGSAGAPGPVGQPGPAGPDGTSDFRVSEGIPQCYIASTGLWVPLCTNCDDFDVLDPGNIGKPWEGGFYVGCISHTRNGVPTHALIVAPRAAGASGSNYGGSPSYEQSTNYKWKINRSVTPGTRNEYDGRVNQDAMIAAGLADHPAANFCQGLNINGFTDWYLPSRYELEIAYHFLKPTTDPSGPSAGVNPYAVPMRGSPFNTLQTPVPEFQAGGSEAFYQDVHWTSTEDDIYPDRTWFCMWLNGGLDSIGKDIPVGIPSLGNTYLYPNGTRVRAMRKVPL